MSIVTFSSEVLWMVVVSVSAYMALAATVVLCLQMRSLRRQVSALQHDTPSRNRPTPAPAQQIPTTSEGMSAEVARWAQPSPAPTEGGGPGIPPGPDTWSERAPWWTTAPRGGMTAVPPDDLPEPPTEPRAGHVDPAPQWHSATAALPSARTNGDRQFGRPDGSVGVADPHLDPDAASAIDRPAVQPGTGRSGPVTGGVYIGGNGKGQDRAQVTFNPAPQPWGWYAYAIVCDGVGGIGDGAVAADTALASFSTAMEQWLADHPGRLRKGDPNRITDSLETGVRAAHIATRELSRNPLRRGSATTLDAALVIPAQDQGTVALVTHVGDGTLWTLDVHGLRRLAADPLPAAPRPLGADLELSAELRKVPLPPGTRLVLTSDGFEAGLTRGAAGSLATASSIATTLVSNGSSSAEIAHCIGGLAAAGSPDDVTVVVVG